MISKETATELALTHREIEVAETLLAEVKAAMDRNSSGGDFRDVFGRRTHHLELGVPSGATSKRLFQVPYSLAVPVIEATIASNRAVLAALCIKAAEENQA